MADEFSGKVPETDSLGSKSNEPKEVSLTNNCQEDASNELDELLDDALEDFSRPPAPPYEQQPCSSSKDTANKSAKKTIENNPEGDPLFESLLGDNDLMKMTEDLNQVLEQMAQNDPAMMAEWQKFQEAAASENAEETPFGGIDGNIAKTMEELTKNLHKLETSNDPMEEMFLQAQKEMGGDMFNEAGTPSMNSFMGAMQGMMGNLLSKELLYPSLKEIDVKYPEWLSDNKDKLSAEDYAKYKNQKEVVHQVCIVFENQKDSDSDELKKQQSTQIVDLMQQMQQYGQPPEDLMRTIVGDDENGATATPPPMTECSVM